MARPDGTIYTGKVIWPLLYMPYVKNQGVFSCPSDTTVRSSVSNTWGKPFAMSYGTNLRVHRCVDTIQCRTGQALALAAIDAPADTYWIADVWNGSPIGIESGPINSCAWNNGRRTNGVNALANETNRREYRWRKRELKPRF